MYSPFRERKVGKGKKNTNEEMPFNALWGKKYFATSLC